MSTSASKGNKRTAVFWELQKAQQHLKNASDELASVQEVLKELKTALGKVTTAGALAQATHVGNKPKRDALPPRIRNKITVLGHQIEALMLLVKAIPVTKDERVAAKFKKAARGCIKKER